MSEGEEIKRKMELAEREIEEYVKNEDKKRAPESPEENPNRYDRTKQAKGEK
jgi:hypothetical protein